MGDRTGIAWTDATKECRHCRVVKDAAAFSPDRSTSDGLTSWCRDCRSGRQRSSYVRKERPGPFGPRPLQARGGDKKQARHRVNHLVDIGQLPNPNDVPCADCADQTFLSPIQRRHEYDHYLGYASEHHLDVEAVCSTCHHNREEARRG